MAVNIEVDSPEIEIAVTAYDGYVEVTGISAPLAVGEAQVVKGNLVDAGPATTALVVGGAQTIEGDGVDADGTSTALVTGDAQTTKGDGVAADGTDVQVAVGSAQTTEGDTSQADGIAAPLVMGEVQTDHLKPDHRWQMPQPRNLLSDPESFDPDTTVWEELSLLLDQHPGAAAAYSLRKLRSGYSGDCIRVRRSSDNAETDIGFSGGTLDTSALLNFVGGGDGFVQTWYGQSGNLNDMTQLTEANQPKIVDSGTLITSNSDLAIDFSTGLMDTTTITSLDDNHQYTSFDVYDTPTPSATEVVATLYWEKQGGANGEFIGVNSSPEIFQNTRDSGNFIEEITSLSQNRNLSVKKVTTTFTARNNGVKFGSGQAADDEPVGNFQHFAVGARLNNGRNIDFRYNGKTMEHIIYPSVPSITNVEQNINSFYSIYP